MSVTLLPEHHLEFLSLKGGYTGLSESTLVKMQLCWKSHATANLLILSARSQHARIIAKLQKPVIRNNAVGVKQNYDNYSLAYKTSQ